MEKIQLLNQQNASLSRGNGETDASTTGLMDFIQDEKEAQTEKEGRKKQKDILVESRLNEKVETNKKKEIEKDDSLSVSDVPSSPLLTCEFGQDHELLQDRYVIILT